MLIHTHTYIHTYIHTLLSCSIYSLEPYYILCMFVIMHQVSTRESVLHLVAPLRLSAHTPRACMLRNNKEDKMDYIYIYILMVMKANDILQANGHDDVSHSPIGV